ncbi:MAG TPA: metalloregulator ArsR/SmtB family transcription factor [Solirubrobacterales bacterium]
MLLEGPGWRVQNTEENRGRRGEGVNGSIEFVTGKPIPYEAIKITGSNQKPHESGMLPASVRQRRVEVRWGPAGLKETIGWIHKAAHPHGRKVVHLPVLGTTAYVDTRDEFFVNQGGPGNRQMVALWSEGGDVFERRAAVPDLQAFEERLGWLNKADPQAWLEALPAKVVAPAAYDATVREVLKGIPTPKSFAPSRVPNEELVTDRYQVGATTAGTVSCLWLRQWGAARRSGDTASAEEAVKAMATSRHWPILRWMTHEGDYSEVLWEIAKWMPKGYFEWHGHKRSLLAQAEGLGCANYGCRCCRRRSRRRANADPPRPVPGRVLIYNQMVVDTEESRDTEEADDRLFGALADSTRRDIFRRAREGRLSVSALAREYPISVTAVQKHVGVLERAELVSRERVGRETIVRAETEGLKRAHAALDRLALEWRGRIGRIDRILDEDKGDS